VRWWWRCGTEETWCKGEDWTGGRQGEERRQEEVQGGKAAGAKGSDCL